MCVWDVMNFYFLSLSYSNPNHLLSSKQASKAELNSGLAMKSNVTDVSKSVSELHNLIDRSRSNHDDVSLLMKDYVQKSDFQYVMAQKANVDELRTLLEAKVSQSQFNHELDLVGQKFDELHKEYQKKLSNQVSSREFQALSATVDQKVSVTEFNEQMEQKANKQSVANALHRKANRADIDALLARKAEAVSMSIVLCVYISRCIIASDTSISKNRYIIFLTFNF